MTRFIWLQHRGQAMWVGLAAAAICAAMLWTNAQASDAANLLSGCFTRRDTPAGAHCTQSLVDQFSRNYGFTIPAFELGVPVLLAAVGALTGAPLVAREIEQRTQLVAWTQSVTRRRWYTFKTAAVAAGLFAAGLLAGFTAYRLQRPMTDGGIISSRWIWFDAEGVAPAGIAVLAFALAVAAGAWLRRTLPAVGVALAGTLALTLLATQAVRTWTPVKHSSGPRFAVPRDAWTPRGGADHPVPYHPASQFWPLQLTFLCILVVISVGVLALGWRATRDRAV
jgi:hypothetical protein